MSKKQLLVEKDLFLNEFQQVLSEFSKCKARKKIPDEKKIPVENLQKIIPVENLQKIIPVENQLKRNPGRELTKKISRSR